jgi:hypothetical protein
LLSKEIKGFSSTAPGRTQFFSPPLSAIIPFIETSIPSFGEALEAGDLARRSAIKYSYPGKAVPEYLFLKIEELFM